MTRQIHVRNEESPHENQINTEIDTYNKIWFLRSIAREKKNFWKI